jgi:acyl-CoA synthetase (AMP-forming)/AMP-acid ligase II
LIESSHTVAADRLNLMEGYWNRPDATAAAIPDGWFRSGDIGTQDADGYYYVVDRKKDVILRGAYNVYPREVEEVLYEHPAVAEAAVVGAAHPVSLGPPLVSVCVGNGSTTWPRLRGRARIGISVLAHGQESTCRAISAKHEDRFANVKWEASGDGAVFVQGASLWLNCSVSAELPAGDHAIVLLRVHGLRANPESESLVFHGSHFRQLAAL